jgi:soluble lytic murein transglycosylase-like protein
MKKHLFTILICATAMVASHPAWAQNVVASRDAFGHVVYTEGDPKLQAPQAASAAPASTASPRASASPVTHVAATNAAQSPAPSAPSGPPSSATSRYSGLVYWSSKEHRWKPVPSVSSSTMRAARQAAQEVDTAMSAKTSHALMNSQPVVPGAAASATAAPISVDKAIDEAAHRHGVDPNLVRAVVKVESNYNPHAVSRKGAMGLMQLMPSTAKSMNVGNAFDPNQNVDAGVRHLKNLLENYNGNVELSLAAYNAGSGAVKKNRGIPPYRETRDYVKRITDLYWNSAAKPKVQEARDPDGHRTFTNVD